jgi:HK97 gp10 family phage protein
VAQTRQVMTLEGFDAFRRAIVQAPDLVREHASAAIAKSTYSTSRRTQAKAPVRDGTLRRAIHAVLPQRGGLSGRVMIDPEAFYWRFLEYGFRDFKALGFVRSAAEESDGEFIENMRQALKASERDFSAGRNL